jgi:hypothetical protein
MRKKKTREMKVKLPRTRRRKLLRPVLFPLKMLRLVTLHPMLLLLDDPLSDVCL